MNPFNHKQLEEFSIADCEAYISKYPYGEHIHEVKRHLSGLKKQQKEGPKEELKKEQKQELPKAPQKDIKPKETKKPDKPNSGDKKRSGSIAQSAAQTKDADQSNDDVALIIGVIAVVLIVGTIIITILNNILPYDWWSKCKYLIYAIGLAIGRLAQKKE